MAKNRYEYCIAFDVAKSGRPYMVFPQVFSDDRGTFSEVLKSDGIQDEIMQINRSTSCKLTFRGFHAQKAPYCQSKLVEALTLPIYDIIIDARPDSKSFGLIEAYLLDPKKQNKLYVPRGFLHSFLVPDSTNDIDAVFMYYCDNIYDHKSEIGICPIDVLSKIKTDYQNLSTNLQEVCKIASSNDKLVLSQKDINGIKYDKFMSDMMQQFKDQSILWYV